MPDITVVEAPQLGVNDSSATVIEWYVTDGSHTSEGEPICSLETAKAVFDVEAEASGFLVHLAEIGSDVLVSQPIALIGADLARTQAERSKYAKPEANSESPAGESASRNQPTATRKASEAALRLGVDLEEVPHAGSIINEEDVLHHMGAHRDPDTVLTELSWDSTIKPVAVYGAGRGAVTVKECLDLGDGLRVVCFLDDDPSHAQELEQLPVLDGSALGVLTAHGVHKLFCEIANGVTRLDILRRAQQLGLEVITVIHPMSYVAPSAKVGAGSYVKAGALIETHSVVGQCSIVDNGVIVAHDNTIGEGCHLAPGVAMGSGIEVGDLAVVGTGASVATGVRIGLSAIVAPGSAVVKDVPDLAVVQGVPARIVGWRTGGGGKGIG